MPYQHQRDRELLESLRRRKNGSVLQMIQTLEICSTSLKNDGYSSQSSATSPSHPSHHAHSQKQGDSEVRLRIKQLEQKVLGESTHMGLPIPPQNFPQYVSPRMNFCRNQFFRSSASPHDCDFGNLCNEEEAARYGMPVSGSIFLQEQSLGMPLDRGIHDFHLKAHENAVNSRSGGFKTQAQHKDLSSKLLSNQMEHSFDCAASLPSCYTASTTSTISCSSFDVGSSLPIETFTVPSRARNKRMRGGKCPAVVKAVILTSIVLVVKGVNPAFLYALFLILETHTNRPRIRKDAFKHNPLICMYQEELAHF
mmetsp:Transcript_5705/g.10307  ORF Transcript_5705/g.10307 Transcript_5705/m.10307 type:complete len:310 (-) Transcript_5705:166-1095(-)